VSSKGSKAVPAEEALPGKGPGRTGDVVESTAEGAGPPRREALPPRAV
jgi:hypothetical protein